LGGVLKNILYQNPILVVGFGAEVGLRMDMERYVLKVELFIPIVFLGKFTVVLFQRVSTYFIVATSPPVSTLGTFFSELR
jgi:hypothetical protein